VTSVPAATPLPRGPSVLTLYSAWDLLTAPGCPVCRYAAEARDRYLGWFALEGHAQPGMIATLSASLGMCAAHSRSLMGQPGAAVRLTAVYRYVVMAARDRLADGTARVAPCPACEHDDAASTRALETLLDGLDDTSAADRCRDLGGVCIPHLAAASGRFRRRGIAWLSETMQATLAAADQDRLGWLAGADHDAEARDVLRAAIPPAGAPAPGACAACLASARAERASLARLPVPTDASPAGDGEAAPPLCAGHLADAAVSAAKTGGLPALLTGQAAAAVAGVRPGSGRVRWRSAALHRGGSLRCPTCQERSKAERRALAGVALALRESPWDAHRRPPLCARHHLGLRAADRQAGAMAADGAVATASRLAGELAADFERSTWARRQRAPAPELAAWRRAAAFLDGAVFIGNPPLS
jgi:hypothetical protein